MGLVAVWITGCALGNATDRPNVLLICIDDLRPELACYGVDYIDSPNIDRLARRGRLFGKHYVQAPTCGASRYTLLTGRYGGNSNAALFQRAKKLAANPDSIPPSLPAWFRRQGYQTVSIGKVSHHPGGRGGRDWNDEKTLEMPHSWDRHLLPHGPWQHPRGWMHGLANGEIRVKAGEMDVFQALDGPDTLYPDGLSINESLRQLDRLSKVEKSFFLAVGILRPHLPFGAPAKYLLPYRDREFPPIPHASKPTGKTTWHGSGEFMKYNRWNRNPNQDAEFALEVRRHYAACVSFADEQVGRILKKLEQTGNADNTIVVLWGDHGWHLGEHAVWGKHTLFEESLRSPLIIAYPGIKQPGKRTDSIVETLDIFPTLCELSGIEKPGFVDGVSLKPILEDPQSVGHDAVSYAGGRSTIRTKDHRLILHRDGYAELYNHGTTDPETRNTAEQHPDLVKSLSRRLQDRLQRE
ncbi:MAG: sulfatase [Planctomycetota bacterium]|nr:sulfatase [Planctomycetota bacterium]